MITKPVQPVVLAMHYLLELGLARGILLREDELFCR